MRPPWFGSALTALAVAVGVVGCRQDPDTLEARILESNPPAHQAHRQGELASDRKEDADAIRGFETAARLEPKSALARLNLSIVQSRSGDAHAAIESARAALQLRPEWGLAWRNLATFYADASDLPHAQEAALNGTKYAPGDVEAWLVRGRVAMLQGDLKLSEECARTALKKDERAAAAWLALGDVLLRKPGTTNVTQALSAFSRALQLDRSAYTLQRVGEVERRAGKLEEAAAHLREAARLVPFDATTAYQLSQTLTQLKDPEAAKWSRRARELQERRYALAAIHQKAHLNPGDVSLQTKLAKALELNGDKSGAIRVLKAAYALDPENETVRRSLVRLEAGGAP
jgi:tetratricopeptide (TPR) repeat protein